MAKKWHPLLDRLLVKRDPTPITYPPSHPNAKVVGADFVIPISEREEHRPHTGIIVAVGPGQYVNGTFCPVALAEGQHVLFAHSDTLTKVDDERGELLLMREQDVFLVLDQPKKPSMWQEASIKGDAEGRLCVTEIINVGTHNDS